MSGIILRWGLPALVTVVGGTALAIVTTSAGITADLTSRSANWLATPDTAWASAVFNGRDAILSGTAADDAEVAEAVQRLASLHGVRSVHSAVVIADRADPYVFSATVSDGQLSLAGAVPDDATHEALVASANPAQDELRRAAGAPALAAWRAATDYGLAYVEHFDDGTVTLSGLDLSIEGRAASPEAYDALVALGEQPVPDGVRLVSRSIEPALVSPYAWHAEFDGKAVAVSGYTPDAAFADSLREQGIDGHPVSTSLVLASGAPADFEQTARLLLQNLVRLEDGSADISGDTITMSGAPADQATADSVRRAIASIGAELELAPPRVTAYEFTATVADGRTRFAGYVPDADTRARLASLDGSDVATLELGRGAPARFESALDYGLDLLSHLSDGRFVISNTTLFIEGHAATAADYETLETTLGLGAPQGLILAGAQVRPPLAAPYLWSATKDEAGIVRVAGFVPSAAIRTQLQAAAGRVAEDTTTLADGSPAGFEQQAAAALSLLPRLRTASIEYDGERWAMAGTADTAEAAVDAERLFNTAGLRDAGWTLDITPPQVVEPVPLPVADPYLWSAQKTSDGTVTVTGNLPSDEVKRTLEARVGDAVVDQSSLADGMPEGFLANAASGLDALLALQQGRVAFDGTRWSLSGEVPTNDDRQLIEAALGASVDTGSWDIGIQALNAAPLVSAYRWMATKAADGAVSLSGYVTNEEVRRFVAVRAGTVTHDAMELGSGEPPGFVTDVLAGLEALGHLSYGTVKYENGKWSLSGAPGTAADADKAVAALGGANSGGIGWQYELADPVGEPEAEPATEPEPPAEEPAPETPPTAEPAPESPAAEPEPVPEPAETPAAPAVVETAPAVVETTPAEPATIAAPATTPIVRDYVFAATKPLGGAIALSGVVPADAAKRYFGTLAGDVSTDNLTIDETLPESFLANAEAGIRELANLDAGDLGFDGSTWVLNARVEAEAERPGVTAAIAALPRAGGWQTSISLLPANDVCRGKVGAFATRNAILFQSGSAVLAPESAAAIDELAGYLNACPTATVHVEGHTDTDGDEALNLALSVARAEAVVDALIARGVGYQRLYAVGYGESLPIADNKTAAGKRANRRIAFTILDDDE